MHDDDDDTPYYTYYNLQVTNVGVVYSDLLYIYKHSYTYASYVRDEIYIN